MIHKFDPSWGTHIPVLLKCLEQTEGAVLELGLGISSTPVLHALCEDQDRLLVSYENDPVFIKMFEKYQTVMHHIETMIPNRDWSVVLIDHKPDQTRVEQAIKLAHTAKILILHDSEPAHEDLYHYKQLQSLFKYRFDYTKTKVQTRVLSNFHDLDFLHNS